jgi:hypothetical protein
LAGLNFSDTKREVADDLVDQLVRLEAKYQGVTLQLMLELSSMSRLPNLEQIKDAQDRALRLAEAEASITHLRNMTSAYASHREAAERLEHERQANAAQAAALRRFNDDIEALRLRFLELEAEQDVHKRGYAFERLLNELFLLYDLEPRIAYQLELEQIDGSFTFDTYDYIVEARWRKEPADRGDGDIFAAKVRSKGKNAIGLFVSVKGFKSPFIDRFSEATPFITLEGGDLYVVLDNRVRLDDLLRGKKRHANDTGSCYLPASRMMS